MKGPEKQITKEPFKMAMVSMTETIDNGASLLLSRAHGLDLQESHHPSGQIWISNNHN